MTHPFHPLYGQQFEILTCRHNWGEYRLTFYETPDHIRGQPACADSLAHLCSNEPLISDEWHGSENQRQDLQAVETGEIVGEEAIVATDVPRASTGKLWREGPRSRFLLERR